MADRIISMRQQLFDALRARGTEIIYKLDVLLTLQVLDWKILAYGLDQTKKEKTKIWVLFILGRYTW